VSAKVKVYSPNATVNEEQADIEITQLCKPLTNHNDTIATGFICN